MGGGPYDRGPLQVDGQMERARSPPHARCLLDWLTFGRAAGRGHSPSPLHNGPQPRYVVNTCKGRQGSPHTQMPIPERTGPTHPTADHCCPPPPSRSVDNGIAPPPPQSPGAWRRHGPLPPVHQAHPQPDDCHRLSLCLSKTRTAPPSPFHPSAAHSGWYSGHTPPVSATVMIFSRRPAVVRRGPHRSARPLPPRPLRPPGPRRPRTPSPV